MVNSERALKSIFLSVIMCLSVFAAGVTFTGGTVAVSGNTVSNTAGNAGITIAQTAANQVSNPDFTGNYGNVGPGNDTIRVNFTNTGADLSPTGTNPTVDQVTIDGTAVNLSKTNINWNTETVDIELPQAISSGGSATVFVSMRGIRNPDTVASHGFTIDLRNSTDDTTEVRAGGTVSIVEGADVSGKVTDADTGSGMDDSSLLVEFVDSSENTIITSYGADASGNYAATVPPEADRIRVNADDYARTSTSISVNNGDSVTENFALDSGTWINGTVTDSSGSGLSGITVFAEAKSTKTAVASEITASDGSYSLAVNHTDDHAVVAGVETSDRELDYQTGLSPVEDTTATINLTTPEKPGDGTLKVDVSDSDGNAVSGATIYVRSSDFKYGGTAETDSKGVASFTKPASQYTIRVESSSYGSKMVRDVSLNETETKTKSISLDPSTTISGTVTNTKNNGEKGVTVLVSDGQQFYVSETDDNGDYTTTVSEGDYTVSVLTKGRTAPAQSVSPSEGSPATGTDFALEKQSVVDTNASIIDGSGDDSNLAVGSTIQSGLLKAKLYDTSTGNPTGKPADLSTLGVDSTTEFEIRITVNNFNADALLWGIKNGSWKTESNGTNTDIIITGSTADIHIVKKNAFGPLLTQNPSQVNWPTGRDAAADAGVDNTVYFGLYNLSTIPGPAQNNLKGISTTTNAQAFAPPTFQNDTLRVWLGAPSKRVDGKDHTGFYQADIPQSQLDDWGVTEPETELQVTYKNSQREYSVTDTANGARIVITNISYSASYAEIEPDQDAINDNNNGDDSDDSSGGGGGITYGGDSDTDDTDSPKIQDATKDGDTNGSVYKTTIQSVGTNETVSITNISEAINESIANTSETDTGENKTTASASVDNLNITFNSAQERVSVEAGVNSSAGETTGAPDQGETIEYVQIDTNTSEEAIHTAEFEVSVSKSERERLGVSPDNVVVYRFHDEEWHALNTTHVGDDSYKVTTPGFSVFAVGTDVSYGDATLDAATISPGEQVTGEIDITNNGGVETTVNLTMATADTTLSTVSVDVPANTTTTATLSGTLSTPGSYSLRINDESAGTLQVSEQSTATESETTAERTTSGSGPGFTVVATLVAILALTIGLRRRRV